MISTARTRAHACTGEGLVSLHPDHISAMITGKRQAWLQGKPWISGPWSLDPALAPGPCLGPWPFGPCPDPWPLALALAPARGPWPVAPSPGLGPCPGSLALGPCPDICPGPKGPGNLALPWPWPLTCGSQAPGPVPTDLLWRIGRSAEGLVGIYSYRPADLRPVAPCRRIFWGVPGDLLKV